MKNVRKIMVIGWVLIIALGMFVGCTQDEPSVNSGSNQQESEQDSEQNVVEDSGQDNEATESKEEVTIRFSWWGGEERHQGTLEAINKYMEENPHVKIEAEYGGWDGYYEKLVTQLAGGVAPDVMQVDPAWIYDLAEQGDLFVDLKEHTDQLDISEFDEKFLEDHAVINGRLQGLPTGINGLTFIYNTKFFERAGIPNDIEWNWENIIEEGRKAHAENPESYLITTDNWMNEFYLKMYIKQKTGQQWVKDDFTPGFDQEMLAEGLTYLESLIDNDVIQPFEQSMLFDGKTEESPEWVNGNLGIVNNYASTIAKFQGPLEEELGVMLPPISEDAKDTGVIVRPAQFFCVNETSENVDESIKFINWLFNDDEAIITAKDVRGVPATEKGRKILEENNAIDPRIVKAVEISMERSGSPENALSMNSELQRITFDTIQKIGFKKLSPEKAAEEMYNLYVQKLEELKE